MADPTHPQTQDGGIEEREAERASLSLRPAKMVCQSGEYICQVRDVSTLGVGLAFLHPIPPEARIILQLANDATYPIERVWIGKRQAGYRFGCDVTLEEFVGEKSAYEARALRLKVSAPARLKDGREEITARLVDLACEGARIECDGDLALGRLFGFEVEGMSAQLCEIRWRDGKQFGVSFQHALTLKELAHCALQLQPFGSSLPSGFTGLLSGARAA